MLTTHVHAQDGAVNQNNVVETPDIKAFPNPDVVFEYDRTVNMSDGLPLHINIYRPKAPGKYPVIITHGLYGKDVAWQTAQPYLDAWKKMTQKIPDLCKGSTCQFMRWEMPDPERWVPEGYIVIHADSRGSGKTSGYLDPLGSRETQDYKELIEWASTQNWSNGKVGLLGISYYAINQWQVAALKPKGLAAIIPWEGAVDAYRDIAYHGGIPSTQFVSLWYNKQILPNQHGNGQSTFVDAVVGGSAVGTAQPESYLLNSRTSMLEDMLSKPFDGSFYDQKTPDLSRIDIPVLSVGNWAGAGLHLRGNLDGYLGVSSKQKWLRMHSSDHFSPFYQEFKIQKDFFDRFLKDDVHAFNNQPNVTITVRDPVRGNKIRAEKNWPLEGTQFQKYYLSSGDLKLESNTSHRQTTVSYDALSNGVTFKLPSSKQYREFTGPLMAKLWVSSSTTDADLFLTVRLLDPTGKDITFEGSNAPAIPVTHGWLRLSHRELDREKSTTYQPIHLHTEKLAVQPNVPYPADIEIWPTSIVVPPNYTLALTIQGRDFSFPSQSDGPFQSTTPFMHLGRDAAEFKGKQTIYTGGKFDSYILLPFIPNKR
ncbi:CocE/NonD family hydrolase [Acinetobacter puyangensis]|nr:CocE/NonD family hydrolase [Acinetobacter puyangensis]